MKYEQATARGADTDEIVWDDALKTWRIERHNMIANRRARRLRARIVRRTGRA